MSEPILREFIHDLRNLLAIYEGKLNRQPYWNGYREYIEGTATESMSLNDYIIIDSSTYVSGWRKIKQGESPMGQLITIMGDEKNAQIGDVLKIELIGENRYGQTS